MQGEADEVAMLAAFEHCTERGWVADGVIAQGEGQAAQLWRLREGITESLARHEPYKNDVSVRVSAMPAFLAEAQDLLGREYPEFDVVWFGHVGDRSEEHTSELQSLMRISYAVFCLKKKKTQ